MFGAKIEENITFFLLYEKGHFLSNEGRLYFTWFYSVEKTATSLQKAKTGQPRDYARISCLYNIILD